jgi:ABC-type antimicrobial peptide transport system permease subunit
MRQASNKDYSLIVHYCFCFVSALIAILSTPIFAVLIFQIEILPFIPISHLLFVLYWVLAYHVIFAALSRAFSMLARRRAADAGEFPDE